MPEQDNKAAEEEAAAAAAAAAKKRPASPTSAEKKDKSAKVDSNKSRLVSSLFSPSSSPYTCLQSQPADCWLSLRSCVP